MLDKDGYILTNAHVVQGASAVTIAPAGSSNERAARVIGASMCDDLAVIKAETSDGLVPAQLGSSGTLQSGQDIGVFGYALGDTFGKDPAITRGIVSRLNVQFDNYENLIQTDATINHGNSGGPVIGTDGKVVGVATLTFQSVASNTNFAISIDQAKPVITDLRTGHNKLWLGMNLEYNQYGKYFGTDDGVGMVVVGVDSGGPAEKIGVQPAMLLYALAGTNVNSLGDVCKILRSHGDGDVLKADFLAVTNSGAAQVQGNLTVGGPKGDASKNDMLVVIGQPASTSTAANNTATATASSAATAQSAGYTAQYDFAQDNGDWPTGEDDNVKASIASSVYTIAIKTASYYELLFPKPEPEAADEAIGTIVAFSSPSGLAGVATRESVDSGKNVNAYACVIRMDGMFSCWLIQAGNFKAIKDWTASKLIKTNGPNTLIMETQGNKTTFSINNTDVYSFTDATLTSGKATLFMESGKDVPFTAQFGKTALQSQ